MTAAFDSVDDLLFQAGRASPDRPAVHQDGQVLSFRELDALVGRTAAYLAMRGLGHGTRVGIAFGNSIDHAILILACFRAGTVYVPIDWRARPAEAERLYDDFGLAACLVEPGHRLDRLAGAIPVDENWHAAVAAAEPYAGKVAGGNDWLLINLSSGTTSRAKGAVITHDQYIRRMASYRRTLGAVGGGKFLSMLPMSFSAGRNFLCYNLSIGNTVVIDKPLLSPAEIVERIDRHGITSIFLPPVTIRGLLGLATSGRTPVPGLKQLVSGTDKLTPAEKRDIAARLCPEFTMI